MRKGIAIFLLLGGMGLGQQAAKHALQSKAKPYNGFTVKVTSVMTNAHGLRFIRASEEPPVLPEGSTASRKLRDFTFTCNVDAVTCETPALDGIYMIEDLHARFYKCDNYTLASGPVDQRQLISVCLDNVD